VSSPVIIALAHPAKVIASHLGLTPSFLVHVRPLAAAGELTESAYVVTEPHRQTLRSRQMSKNRGRTRRPSIGDLCYRTTNGLDTTEPQPHLASPAAHWISRS
jgi:hypothetical protein